jgi:DNA repair protein RecO (recombination protein O)
MPHAPAPHLYQLLVSYLQNLPHCQFPHAAVASFQLKVLRHEGLISLLPICSICRTDLHHQFLAQGESFCSLHAPAFALELCPEETLLLQNLAFCKTFSQIAKISLSDAFKRKIKTLFWDRLHQ